MKKRCTNSSCRKEFKVSSEKGSICPYCGMEYPRLIGQSRAVILTKSGSNRLAVIKVIRRHTGFNLRQAKTIFDFIPSLVASGLTLQQALACQRQLREAGSDARIVPAGSCKRKGVFVSHE